MSDTKNKKQLKDDDSDKAPVLDTAPVFVKAIIIILTVGLVAVVLTTPIISDFPLASFDVTDGEVNGTVKLGAFGYCLYLLNQDIACHGGIGYSIDTNVLFHAEPISPATTKFLSISILVVFLIELATLLSLFKCRSENLELSTSLSAFAVGLLLLAGIVSLAASIQPFNIVPGFIITNVVGGASIVFGVFNCCSDFMRKQYHKKELPPTCWTMHCSAPETKEDSESIKKQLV